MVSDSPRSDRCGARVTDKVGLEIQTDEQTITDKDGIAAVELSSSDGEVAVHSEPTYKTLREYLWDDYELTGVALGSDHSTDVPWEPAHTVYDPDITAGHVPDGLSWYRPAGVQKVTNARAELQGYCERYSMLEPDHGRCYVHQGGHGVEGNTNAMTHGMLAKRSNFYNALDDELKQVVEMMVDSWVEQAPYDRDAHAFVTELYRLAIDQIRAWSGLDEFVDEDGEIIGLTKERVIGVTDDNEPIEAEDEHPANMPYSRLDSDIRQKLKEHGIYDSPDQQQAENTASFARILSGMADE